MQQTWLYAVVLGLVMVGCRGAVSITVVAPDENLDFWYELLVYSRPEGCPSLAQVLAGEPPIRSLLFDRDSDDEVGELSTADYQFAVIGRNAACDVVSFGCQEVSPSDDAVRIMLQSVAAPNGTPGCPADRACDGQGRCISLLPDAGNEDASDGGPLDGQTPMDGGPEDMDSGPDDIDSGPDDMDSGPDDGGDEGTVFFDDFTDDDGTPLEDHDALWPWLTDTDNVHIQSNHIEAESAADVATYYNYPTTPIGTANYKVSVVVVFGDTDDFANFYLYARYQNNTEYYGFQLFDNGSNCIYRGSSCELMCSNFTLSAGAEYLVELSVDGSTPVDLDVSVQPVAGGPAETCSYTDFSAPISSEGGFGFQISTQSTASGVILDDYRVSLLE